MKYELIITIVNNGYSSEVMDHAIKGGATGGTVVMSRGSAGTHTANKILGISITPEKETVLILTTAENKTSIMKSIIEGVGLNTLGKGICFSLPVDDVLGISLGFNNLPETEDIEQAVLETEEQKDE